MGSNNAGTAFQVRLLGEDFVALDVRGENAGAVVGEERSMSAGDVERAAALIRSWAWTTPVAYQYPAHSGFDQAIGCRWT